MSLDGVQLSWWILNAYNDVNGGSGGGGGSRAHAVVEMQRLGDRVWAEAHREPIPVSPGPGGGSKGGGGGEGENGEGGGGSGGGGSIGGIGKDGVLQQTCVLRGLPPGTTYAVRVVLVVTSSSSTTATGSKGSGNNGGNAAEKSGGGISKSQARGAGGVKPSDNGVKRGLPSKKLVSGPLPPRRMYCTSSTT